MPNCPNCNITVWDLNCPNCKTPIPYDQLVKKLVNLPEIEVRFENLTVLFVGLEPAEIKKAYVPKIEIGGEDIEAPQSLTLMHIDGGTWLDYSKRYSSVIKNWLRRVCYTSSRYKMIVVNTCNPLSVAVLSSHALEGSETILALTADDSSTPLIKNTSYVALKKAYENGQSILLFEEKYLKNLAYFDEDQGLITGEAAFKKIVTNIASNIQTLNHFVEGDKKLGITNHTISTLLSASDHVYKSITTLFQINAFMNSVEGIDEDYQSIHLLGLSPMALHQQIEKAFKSYCSEFKDLLNSEIILREKSSIYNFYDLYIFFGLKEDPVLKKIETGYRSIAKKIPSLSLEED
jgi:hypothetical protein